MLVQSRYRPDMVARTGVIEPFPIRTESPVAAARAAIGPFRRSGGLGNPANAVRARAAALRERAPIATSALPPGIGMKAGVMARVVPAQFQPMNTAWRRLQDAYARGSIWHIIRARAIAMRLGRRRIQ